MVKSMLEEKKQKFESTVKKCTNLMNKFFILELLYDNHLNNYIIELTDKKIYVKKPTIIENGYLTEYEQFTYVLDNFVTHFINTFNSIELAYQVVPMCLKNDKRKILLTKKNYYDSRYIKYFNKEFNKIIITNFYNNILELEKELNRFLITANISLRDININDIIDINEILFLLEELCFVNRNRYIITVLFDAITKSNRRTFLIYYELLFTMYERNITFVGEYRKFKNRNNMYQCI